MPDKAETLVAVNPKATPYFFSKGETGCLLLHGFTGSPPELLPLGEFLKEQDFTVLGPLLAGHGTRVQDLARTRWIDWLESAQLALERLRLEPIKRLYLIGLSMGGLLALLLTLNLSFSAREHKGSKEFWQDKVLPPKLSVFTGPADPESAVGTVPIAGVITLNTPIFLWDHKARFSPWLQWFFPFAPKRLSRISVEEADALRFSYSEIPLRGVVNLMRLINGVKEHLPRVSVPALVIQSRVDETVRPESGSYIYRNLGSNTKTITWLEEAPHLLTLSREKERIFQSISEWIKVTG